MKPFIRDILFFSAAFLLVGCQEEAATVWPSERMPRDQFTALYADVHVLEAAIKQKLLNGYDSTPEIGRYYQYVFAQHEATRVEYDSCLAWYTRHPKEMQSMLEQAMNRIAQLQADGGYPVAKEVETERRRGLLPVTSDSLDLLE